MRDALPYLLIYHFSLPIIEGASSQGDLTSPLIFQGVYIMQHALSSAIKFIGSIAIICWLIATLLDLAIKIVVTVLPIAVVALVAWVGYKYFFKDKIAEMKDQSM